VTAGTIVLLRHGRTAWNDEGRFQGQTDIPLDDVGRRQVLVGADALVRRHRATRIVSSDLVRAHATAQAYVAALARARGGPGAVPPLLTDERLRETFCGAWEGLDIAEVTARWPQEWAAWRRGDDDQVRPPGGETRAEVARRMRAAIVEHADALEPHDTLLIVSHGGAINLAISALLGLAPARLCFRVLGNAQWSQLVAAPPGASPAWRVASHNVGPGDADEVSTGP
jgi:probable phosphoglycerate mutase